MSAGDYLDGIVQMTRDTTKRSVMFANAVPGFRYLSVEDQKLNITKKHALMFYVSITIAFNKKISVSGKR